MVGFVRWFSVDRRDLMIALQSVHREGNIAHLKDLRFASDVERNQEITDTRNL
jgi:hypothetical protein